MDTRLLLHGQYFNPRSRKESDRPSKMHHMSSLTFQSTLSQGERPKSYAEQINCYTNFNPRSRKESDTITA